MLEIGLLQTGDIPRCVRFCQWAGWEQAKADWRRLLALCPQGQFIARYKGIPCGAVCTVRYGSGLGWMGLLFVHPDYRRRGIGSALMNRGIEYLRHEGIRHIKIDATDAGRSVFLKLGFDDERPVHVYVGSLEEQHLEARERVVDDSTWSVISEMDRLAFGADRLALLRLLQAEEFSACALPGADGGAGYGFARAQFDTSYIGPLVANSAEAARHVTATLLEQLPAGKVMMRLLPDNLAAKELAVSLGFHLHERLTRMYLGTVCNPGVLEHVFATAGCQFG